MSHTREDLKIYQSLPLDLKVELTKERIQEWHEHWSGCVCVSFSGGKDSTVLLHLVRSIYPDVKAIFSNTGLEYPEIRRFAQSFDNVVSVRPKMRFDEVISNYGYPIISKEVAECIYYARKGSGKEYERQKERILGKTTFVRRKELNGERVFGDEVEKSRFNKEKYLPLARDMRFGISHYCCAVMKKRPIKEYQAKEKMHPFVGMMTEESKIREQAWLRSGCNSFTGKGISMPLAFWTEQDVLRYIHENNIEIASVYGEIISSDSDGNDYESTLIDRNLKCTGCNRTGCIFCGFGFHLEKGETRFQRLARTHPKQYEYCIGGGQWVDNPNYDATLPEYDGEWKNWNPKKIWTPSKKGLGMGYVFDQCNQIYGKDFMRYE